MAIVESSVDAAAGAVKQQLGPPAPVAPAREVRGLLDPVDRPGARPPVNTPPPTQNFLGAPISNMPGYYPPAPPLPQQPQQPTFVNGVPFEPNGFYGPAPTPLPYTPPSFPQAARRVGNAVNQTVDYTSELGARGGALAGSTIAQGGLLGMGLRKLGVPNTIATGGLGALPGSQQTHEDIGGVVGGLAGGAAPMVALYAVAPEVGIPTAALDAYFAVRGTQGALQTWDDYQSGKIDAKTALIQAAPDILNTVPALFHGAKLGGELKGALEESPAVQRMGGLAGERGSLEPPVGPEGPKVENPASAEGANLPVPPETAAEVTKPEHQELIAALAEIMPSASERVAELKAGRARQFGNRQQAIDEALASGMSNKEALAAGKSALAGDILTRRNLVGTFTPERVESYYGDVLNAEKAGEITGGESIAAENALDLLTEGARSDGNTGPVMKHEAEALARVFGPEIEGVLPTTPEKMTLLQKALAPFQVLRSFKTAFDDSFGGGQGWKLIGQHPEAWWKGKVAGWKAGLSDEAGAEAAMEHLRQTSPNYVRAQNAERPLGIMTTGAGTNPAEEYLSPLTSKIPLLNRTERIFTVGGSYMRQLALDAKVAMWEKANPGKAVPDDVFQSMIDMVNEGTLWGNIKPLGDYSKALGQTFFSIRAKSALVQYPATLVKAIAQGKDPALRKIAARDLGLWVAQNLAVLTAAEGIAQLTGVGKVDVNPFSSNFGQVVVGPVKLDIWQGYGPIARAILQTAGGQQQSFGYNQPKSISRFTPASNYVPGQLSPLGSIAYDTLVRKGQDAGGTKMNTLDYWANQLGPLGIQDAVNGFRQAGPIGGTAATIGSLEGLRVNTYGPGAGAEKANAIAKVNDAGWSEVANHRKQLSDDRSAFVDQQQNRADKEAAGKTWDRKHAVEMNKLNLEEQRFWFAHKDLVGAAYDAGVNVQIPSAMVNRLRTDK